MEGIRSVPPATTRVARRPRPRALPQIQCVIQRTRPKQFELRQAQSSPPASRGAHAVKDPAPCRSGPFPLNQSEPPCSRNPDGFVGSMPSVKLIGLAFCFARSVRHPLRGKRRFMHRTPTASRWHSQWPESLGERPFAALLGSERPLRIHTLDKDGLHFRRLDRGRAAILQQSGFISMPSFQTISWVSARPIPSTRAVIWPSTDISAPPAIVGRPHFVDRDFFSLLTLTSATCAEYEYAGEGTPPPLCRPPRASTGGA